MGADFWIVLQWWGTLFLVGAVAYPLTKALFGQSNQSWEHYTLDPRVRGDDKIKDGVASRSLGEGWWDGGYLFSKAVGMAVVTWIVFVLGTLRLMPFSYLSIIVALIVVFLVGLLVNVTNYELRITNYDKKKSVPTILHTSYFIIRLRKYWKQVAVLIFEELFFLAAILAWSWVKGHEPSIRGLEKFMDYGFMQSILNSQFFPPADMWYAPLSINYYYFGHMVTAVLTRLSGLDLGVTFNLMLVTIFALTLTMSFSIGYQLIFICHSREGGNPVLLKKKDGSPIRLASLTLRRSGSGMTRIFSGFLTAFLVTLAGNMQTIYAFTRGYTGENVKPFWELGWGIRDKGDIGVFGAFWGFWGKIGEGMNTYWYPNATRFIPFTIHEFPSYSFVVSDVHGHVLSIPFVLLAIALLITLFVSFVPDEANHELRIMNYGWKRIGFYGFLVGVLLMTNALDGPIYLGLFFVLLIIHNSKFIIRGKRYWKQIALTTGGVLAVAGLTSLPFLVHFKSFVTGVAVNCPLPFLANMKFGPILFEGVEKCQRSPLWMWWLLWGFFVYCGGGLIWRWIRGIRELRDIGEIGSNKITQTEKMLLVFFVFALVLVIVPEFIYFKDIYPAHFRSNTMFKLGYEAFILFSIVAGYTITSLLSSSGLTRGSSSKYTLDPRLPARNASRIDAGGRGDDKIGSGDDNKKVVDDKIGRFLKSLFFLFLLPQLILVSIYPIFSVRSYFNSLKRYEGIDGLGWLRREYPDDWKGIEWLKNSSKQSVESSKGGTQMNAFSNYQLPATSYLSPVVLVEADGDSYTDYARFSAFTGRPTVIGWAVHEWLWRGTYDAVAPRREDVRMIYESEDLKVTRSLLATYRIHYIIVGTLEREKYKNLQEWKFGQLGREIFRAGGTIIYIIEEPIDKERGA